MILKFLWIISWFFLFNLILTSLIMFIFSWCSPAPEILLEIMQYQKLWWKDITSDRIAGTWQLFIFDGFVSLYLEGFILTEAPNCLNYDCLNTYKLLSFQNREKLQTQHLEKFFSYIELLFYFGKFNLHISIAILFYAILIHEDLKLWNFNFPMFDDFFTVIFYLDLSIYFIKTC